MVAPMDPTKKEELEGAISTAFNEAHKAEEADDKTPRVPGLGLTSLALLDFQGLLNGAVPGELLPPESLNTETMKDDKILIIGIYEEILGSAASVSIPDAFCQIVSVLWDGNPVRIATVLHAFDNFEDAGSTNFTAHDAAGALASAMQSDIELPKESGIYALFTFHAALELAQKQLEMLYKKDERLAAIKALPISLLQPELMIPLPEYDGNVAEADCVVEYIIDATKCASVKLLKFLFY